MIATQEAKPKYDRRTDAALNAAEPACQLVRELVEDRSGDQEERRKKAEQIVEAIEQLALECSRNATDAAKSRELLRSITGVDERRKDRSPSDRGQRARDEAYASQLGGDWPAVVEAVRSYGVRFWGCIADAERSGCDPAHVLKLVELCRLHEGKFKDSRGELCHRIRQAFRGLDPYEGWSIGTLPKPKPPTFDELLSLEFSDEIKAHNATGEGDRDDFLRRWIAFHERHGEDAKRSIYARLHIYCTKLDEAGIVGPERVRLKDQFFETCGAFAPVPPPRSEKTKPR